MKYQYNSTIAFDRAFKKNFGITPVECRQKDIVEIEKNIYSKSRFLKILLQKIPLKHSLISRGINYIIYHSKSTLTIEYKIS